jgi:hypothetical protein
MSYTKTFYGQEQNMEKLRQLLQKISSERNPITRLGLMDEMRTKLNEEYKKTFKEAEKWKR